jgi:hypothetical protein
LCLEGVGGTSVMLAPLSIPLLACGDPSFMLHRCVGCLMAPLAEVDSPVVFKALDPSAISAPTFFRKPAILQPFDPNNPLNYHQPLFLNESVRGSELDVGRVGI